MTGDESVLIKVSITGATIDSLINRTLDDCDDDLEILVSIFHCYQIGVNL